MSSCLFAIMGLRNDHATMRHAMRTCVYRSWFRVKFAFGARIVEVGTTKCLCSLVPPR